MIGAGETLFAGGGIGLSTKKVDVSWQKPLIQTIPLVDAKGVTVNSSGIQSITFSE